MNEIKLQHQVHLNLNFNKKALYLLRAINHPLRLSILKLIDEKQKITVTEIHKSLNIHQAIASQNLAVLKRAGFLQTKKESKFVYYTLQYNFILHFSKTISSLIEKQ